MSVTERLNILIISPSKIISKGLCCLLDDHSGIKVKAVLTTLSRENEVTVRNSDADIIIVDPSISDYSGRANIKDTLSALTEASVVALPTCPVQEEALRRYDEVIGIFDTPSAIINKLRKASRSENKTRTFSDGEELSNREKEILVCVAKGMLNKEIADKFNLSIYTVITHRKNISRKTGIKTVAGLTVYALLNNLIEATNL